MHGHGDEQRRSTTTTVDLRTTVNQQPRDHRRRRRDRRRPAPSSCTNVTLAGAEPGVPSVDPGCARPATSRSTRSASRRSRSATRTSSTSTCPAFVYNGETYTTLGVDSNGYVVAGGGTSEDNNCCNLPDRAGSGAAEQHAGAVLDRPRRHRRAGHLRRRPDRRRQHLARDRVAGERVRHRRRTATSRSGSASTATQDITFAYDPADLPADPAGQPTSWSAPRTSSAQGDVATRPAHRGPAWSPAPTRRRAASFSYTVDVRGHKAGAGVVTTEMTGDRTCRAARRSSRPTSR